MILKNETKLCSLLFSFVLTCYLIDHVLINTVGTDRYFLPLRPGIFSITPIGPRVFSIVWPCVTSDCSDTVDWTLKALGGMMHFIIACWDSQKPVAIIGEGFETFLYHVHALFQQLPSYNNVRLLHRDTLFFLHLNAPL